MAWVDDRIWCHPKYADVSKQARWAAVAAIAYSSGFTTNGYLTNGQVTQLGVTKKERGQLVAAVLWHEVDGGIEIHDWDEHNGKRDARKAADADRKRAAYWKDKGTEPPQETDRRNLRRQAGVSGSTARVDWSEGSDGVTDLTEVQKLKRLAVDLPTAATATATPDLAIRETINQALGAA